MRLNPKDGSSCVFAVEVDDVVVGVDVYFGWSRFNDVGRKYICSWNGDVGD